MVRSFVAWGVLQDTETKGCYVKAKPMAIADQYLTSLLLESALLATPGGKGTLNTFLNTPAMFPFSLLAVTGKQISQFNQRLEISHTAGFDDYSLKLTT